MSFTDPYRVHANRGNGPEPALLLGWYPAPMAVGDVVKTEGMGLVSFADGSLEELGKDWINLDWRYDAPRDSWVTLGDEMPEAEPEPDGS